MKRLKTILLCSICFITIYIVFDGIKHDAVVKPKNISEAIIIDYELKGDLLKLKLKNKLLYVGYYQINSLEEKKWLEKNLEYDMKISFIGEITRPSSNTNFHQFSYRNYLKSQNIDWQLNISKLKSLQSRKSLKSLIKNGIQRRIYHIDKNDIYLSLFLLGNKRNYNDEVYRKLGVSHLFCISGMHFSFFLSFFFLLFKKKDRAKLIALPFMLFYGWILGFSISIIRVLSSLIFSMFKPIHSFLTIHEFYILMFLILLCMNPYRIYDIGFLYSFIVSDALVLYAEKLKKKSLFQQMILISTISFFASIPITLCYSYELQFTSILWNLIYVPLISQLLFPLSFVVILLPDMYIIYSIILKGLEVMNDFIVSNLFNPVIFKKPSLWFYFVYGYCFYFVRNYKYQWFLLITILCVLKISVYFSPDELVIFDVGQGDSLLLKGEKVALIDTGGIVTYREQKWQKRKSLSTGEQVIIPYLKASGITKIDFLILTHGDYDHMGDAITLIEKFKIENVIFNVGDYNELESRLIKKLKKKNIPYYQNVEYLNFGQMKLNFLNTKIYDNENDNSNVIYFRNKAFQFLFMGDAGINKEKDLLKMYHFNQIDFLKIGHHGSKTSSSKSFISTVNPKICFISVGKNNRYGHPDNKVLNNLNTCQIYRTDLVGNIKVTFRYNQYLLTTYSSKNT